MVRTDPQIADIPEACVKDESIKLSQNTVKRRIVDGSQLQVLRSFE